MIIRETLNDTIAYHDEDHNYRQLSTTVGNCRILETT